MRGVEGSLKTKDLSLNCFVLHKVILYCSNGYKIISTDYSNIYRNASM